MGGRNGAPGSSVGTQSGEGRLPLPPLRPMSPAGDGAGGRARTPHRDRAGGAGADLSGSTSAGGHGPRSVPHSHRSRAAPRCAMGLGEDLPGPQNAAGAAVGMDPCSEGAGPESEPLPGSGHEALTRQSPLCPGSPGQGCPDHHPPAAGGPRSVPGTQHPETKSRPSQEAAFHPRVAEGTGSEGRCRRGLERGHRKGLPGAGAEGRGGPHAPAGWENSTWTPSCLPQLSRAAQAPAPAPRVPVRGTGGRASKAARVVGLCCCPFACPLPPGGSAANHGHGHADRGAKLPGRSGRWNPLGAPEAVPCPRAGAVHHAGPQAAALRPEPRRARLPKTPRRVTRRRTEWAEPRETGLAAGSGRARPACHPLPPSPVPTRKPEWVGERVSKPG